MDGWLGFGWHTTGQGIEPGEIRPQVDPDQLATLILSTPEGGIRLAGLYGDGSQLAHVGPSVWLLRSAGHHLA